MVLPAGYFVLFKELIKLKFNVSKKIHNLPFGPYGELGESDCVVILKKDCQGSPSIGLT